MTLKVHKIEKRWPVAAPDVLAPICNEEPWTLGSKVWRWVTCARCRKERPKQGKRKKA